jgi:sugar/nucleoside kinase (ribokinase family)
MNREEAQEFTGERESLQMVHNLLSLGVKLVSITDGGNGSIISDGKKIINSGVYHGKITDTTGAGDAFLSGILVSMLNNFSLEKTSKIASAMGAFECREEGVREGLPSNLEELEEFVKNNSIKQVMSVIS